MKLKKRLKSNLITITIIIAVIVLSVIILTNPGNKSEVPESTAKCIGENSALFVQLGCPHCEDQKEIFGNNVQYINVTDCFYNKETCIYENITAIPTWKINDKYYIGVQSIEKLKELTGCK